MRTVIKLTEEEIQSHQCSTHHCKNMAIKARSIGKGRILFNCFDCHEKFKEKKRPYERQRAKKRNEEYRGTLIKRFWSLQEKARIDGVKNHITKEELEHILQTRFCYLTGIKISEHLEETSKAYYLDRIGKKEHGGNGLGGGDYHLDNVLPCLFSANSAREKLGLTTTQMKYLFLPAKVYFKTKSIYNKIKKFFK